MLSLGGVEKQKNTFMNFSRERLLIDMELAMWTILPISTTISSKTLAPTRHFFLSLSNPWSLLWDSLYLCCLSHFYHIHNLLLKASQMTVGLFNPDPLVLLLWQGGDLDCFLLVDEDETKSKLISIKMVKVQSFSKKLEGMTDYLESLGCWIIIYERTSIANGSRACF